MEELASMKCVACEGGIPPLSMEKSVELLKSLHAWKLGETRDGIPRLEKVFKLQNFKQAVQFVNEIAEIAESEGHHPDICVFGWNKVKIELYTRAIRGLHENDFIMAAKIEREFASLEKTFAKPPLPVA